MITPQTRGHQRSMLTHGYLLHMGGLTLFAKPVGTELKCTMQSHMMVGVVVVDWQVPVEAIDEWDVKPLRFHNTRWPRWQRDTRISGVHAVAI